MICPECRIAALDELAQAFEVAADALDQKACEQRAAEMETIRAVKAGYMPGPVPSDLWERRHELEQSAKTKRAMAADIRAAIEVHREIDTEKTAAAAP